MHWFSLTFEKCSASKLPWNTAGRWHYNLCTLTWEGQYSLVLLSQAFLMLLLYFHNWVVVRLKGKNPHHSQKRITLNCTVLTFVFSMWGQPESPQGCPLSCNRPEAFSFFVLFLIFGYKATYLSIHTRNHTTRSFWIFRFVLMQK